MLAKANRLTHGSDFKRVVRRGARVRGNSTVTYVLRRETSMTPRFGIIVGKAVGNAVHRNLVRRRCRAGCSFLLETAAGHDIVIRALPASAQAPWDSLHEEISRSVSKGTTR